MLNKTHFFTGVLLSLGLVVTGCASTNAQTQGKDSQAMPKHEQKHHFKKDVDKKFEKKGDKDGHHFDKLNLTDAQKQQLETLRKQNDDKMKQLHDSLKQQDANITKQKQAGASTATLLALHQQKQATMDSLKALHETAEKQFMSILTPEQQLQMYEAHGKGMKGERGKSMEKRESQRHVPPADVPKPKMQKPAM